MYGGMKGKDGYNVNVPNGTGATNRRSPAETLSKSYQCPPPAGPRSKAPKPKLAPTRSASSASHSVLSQAGLQASVLAQADQPPPVSSKPGQLVKSASRLRFDDHDVPVQTSKLPRPLVRAGTTRLSFDDINEERLARRQRERAGRESDGGESDGEGTFLKKSTRDRLLSSASHAKGLAASTWQTSEGGGDDNLRPAIAFKMRKWKRKAYVSASCFRQLADCLSRAGDRVCDYFNLITSFLLSVLFLLVDEGVFEIFLKSPRESNPMCPILQHMHSHTSRP